MSGIVQISCLGNNGRFGNQCFQWSFARKYAELHDATLQTPEWVGQKLFEGIDDPPLSRPLCPRTKPDVVPWGQTDIDLFGYFQYQRCVEKLSREELRRWFRFKPEFLERFPRPEKPYIAAHVRRGDYLTWAAHAYCVVSNQSYINACRNFGFNEADLVWVNEEYPRVDEELEERGLGFLPDFFTLLNADVILRANSTFSWWAAVLGNGRVYSPVVQNRVGLHDVEFIEGNWPRMCDTENTKGNVTDLHLPD